jgi:DNA-directed RNA polymerase specialized sigma24 family protein
LDQRDLELLNRAVRGEKQALVMICRRYKAVVLAVAIRTGCELDRAFESVEPIIHQLCDQLLARRIRPEQWTAELTAAVAARFHTDDNQADGDASNASMLSGLDGIPRLAKRRALRMLLPQLPLAELTALLLRYVERYSPAEMVGLVAESESGVAAKLFAAHETMAREMRKSRSASRE